MTEWINVKDRLPEYDDLILLLYGGAEYHLGKLRHEDTPELPPPPKDYFEVYDCGGDPWQEPIPGAVTHWMPLPEPPGTMMIVQTHFYNDEQKCACEKIRPTFKDFVQEPPK